MKKFMLLLPLTLVLGYASAQKVKENAVPDAVKQSFRQQYPTVKDVKWEKEAVNYEAGFEVNGTETSVVYDAAGKLLETETEIAVAALPEAVQKYCAQNMPGKKIKEAARIVDASGNTLYEAEVGGKDYLFDASGKLLKKE